MGPLGIKESIAIHTNGYRGMLMILSAASEGKFTSKMTGTAVTFNVLEILIRGRAGHAATRGNINLVGPVACRWIGTQYGERLAE